MSASDLVTGLRKETGALAAAVISRDGLVVEADLPPEVSPETFSIMCAAILGAAMTATNEMGKGPPKRIDMVSEDVRILLYAAGRKSMLVVALPPDADVPKVDARAGDAVKRLAAGVS